MMGRGGGELSGLDISVMRGSSGEHQAFSISVQYTGEQLALCSSHISPWERVPCVHWWDLCCPGDEHGRPSFCRLSCGHPVHSNLLYQATTAPMISCTDQY